MGQDTVDVQLRLLLSRHAPMRAKEIAKSLLQQGLQADTTEVNRRLYQMQKCGQAIQHPDYTWTLAGNPQPQPGRQAAPATGSSSPHSGTQDMPVTLTEQQRRCVNFEPSGNLLIRGEPGSGKTTVLAARAGLLMDLLSGGSMLFLTYNAALSAYVKSMLERNDSAKDVRVNTFHGWCADVHESMTGKRPRIYWDKDRKAAIAQLIAKQRASKSHRLLDADEEFWAGEVEWLYGQAVSTRQDYQDATRSGRGTSIQVRPGEDRDVVWNVFEAYQAKLESEGAFDGANGPGMILDAVEAGSQEVFETLKCDHVFVDEVQDFDKAWLAVLAPFARQSLTMAGDLAQRIYRRNFTWKGVGIELPPARSIGLRGSHRTTREIMQVAMHVIAGVDVSKDAEFNAPTLPDKSGPKVGRLVRSSWQDAEKDAAAYALRLSQQNPGHTVVVAVPFRKKVEAMARLIGPGKCVTASGNELAGLKAGIAVTTLHQLKGLEFDHVIVADMEDATVPEWFCRQPGDETAEERIHRLRCLVYVALTRAKRTATVAGAAPLCRFFNPVPALDFNTL